MPRPLRVLQFGLGPIGQATARALLRRDGYTLVGAVDHDPALSGRDLGGVLGMRRRLGIPVAATPERWLSRSLTHLAFHTTVSDAGEAAAQIGPLLTAGIDVVTSTEVLAFPWTRNPVVAHKLDRLARKGGATLHGTGVNPGFAMDVLALVLSQSALTVRGVTARRVVDASTRRLPLRMKVGAGLTPAAFRKRAREGSIGYRGLLESMDLVAAGLGWTIDETTHRLEPVIAPAALAGPPEVPPGGVAGQRETLRGLRGGKEVLRFELTIALGAANPRDEVLLRGEPTLKLRVEGGTPRDAATAAALINSGHRVAAAEPGLKTALDLPLPHYAEVKA